MARRFKVPFVGETARSRSVKVNNQRTFNLMAGVKRPGAKEQVILESVPGTVDFRSAGDGIARSPTMIPSAIRGTRDLYGVFGTKLVAQTQASGNVDVGTLLTTASKCVIAAGRNYVMVVDGENGYTYDGTTFAKITDADFPPNTTHCLYLDGFFIVNNAATDLWYISAKEDPTNWNALDFDAAAVHPDRALAMSNTESLLWLIGEVSAQAYYNSGNPDFPYDIVLSATKEVGICAPYSVAESDAGIFWLATTREGGLFVYRIQGQQGEKITGDEQESQLAELLDPETAYGFVYQQAGKSFYVLQLGASGGDDARPNSTLVYNITAGTWEERAIIDGSAWRAGSAGVLGKDNIIGSRLGPQTYKLDLKNYQDAGTDMIRVRRTAVQHQNDHRLDYFAVVVDIETGQAPDPNESPRIRLRFSDDNGLTWSSYLSQSASKQGEYKKRVRWPSLGSSRQRMFEISFTGNAPATILAGYVEGEILED